MSLLWHSLVTHHLPIRLSFRHPRASLAVYRCKLQFDKALPVSNCYSQMWRWSIEIRHGLVQRLWKSLRGRNLGDSTRRYSVRYTDCNWLWRIVMGSGTWYTVERVTKEYTARSNSMRSVYTRYDVCDHGLSGISFPPHNMQVETAIAGGFLLQKADCQPCSQRLQYIVSFFVDEFVFHNSFKWFVKRWPIHQALQCTSIHPTKRSRSFWPIIACHPFLFFLYLGVRVNLMTGMITEKRSTFSTDPWSYIFSPSGWIFIRRSIVFKLH